MDCAGAAMDVESPESVMKEENCEVEEEKFQILSDVRSSSEVRKQGAKLFLDHFTARSRN